jgi:hypothetical protein
MVDGTIAATARVATGMVVGKLYTRLPVQRGLNRQTRKSRWLHFSRPERFFGSRRWCDVLPQRGLPSRDRRTPPTRQFPPIEPPIML